MDTEDCKQQKIARILERANLPQPQIIRVSARPTNSHESDIDSSVLDEARYLLQQRRALSLGQVKEPNQKPRHRLSMQQMRDVLPEHVPTRGLQRLLSTSSRRSAGGSIYLKSSSQSTLHEDTRSWDEEPRPMIPQATYTKHEVATAFDATISQNIRQNGELARAILSFASFDSLEELWCHYVNPKLEKRQTRRLRSSGPADASGMTWLVDAVRHKRLIYLQLMCSMRTAQTQFDECLRIALAEDSMDVLEVLLDYEANTTPHQDTVKDMLKQNNAMELTRRLLTAPSTLSLEAWRSCLLSCLTDNPLVVLLAVSNYPDIIDASLLQSALDVRSFEGAAAMLAYASLSVTAKLDITQVCTLVCGNRDPDQRWKYFELLAEVGLVGDCLATQAELMQALRLHQYDLARILIAAGVVVDNGSNNAIHLALTEMDMKALRLVVTGSRCSAVSPSLRSMPLTATEGDILEILTIMTPLHLSGAPINSLLVRAARQKYVRLAQTLLIDYKASIEALQCSAVQVALRNVDFDMLDTLLRHGKSSPEELSTVIPLAMGMLSRSNRTKAVQALLRNGLNSGDLGAPLQQLVAEPGECDITLIELLLKHNTPIDRVGVTADNAVLTAIRRGDVTVLTMLCKAASSREIHSTAVTLAIQHANEHGDKITSDMMRILLEEGAKGAAIDQALVRAVTEDYPIDLVRLLVQHGADANSEAAACYDRALVHDNIDLLETLCDNCPPSYTTIRLVLPRAIDPRYYKQEKFDRLLGAVDDCGQVLNELWASRVIREPRDLVKHPRAAAVLTSLLKHGLSIDLDNGTVLRFVIETRDALLLRQVLSTHRPTTRTLAATFSTVSRVPNSNVRHLFIRFLLEAAESAEIGQSEALLQEVVLSEKDGQNGLKLLIEHKAVVDRHDAAALQYAARKGILPSLDMLIAAKPSVSSLKRACMTTATSGLSGKQTDEILTRLLNADDGRLEAELPSLVIQAIIERPMISKLPELLIQHGAKVTIEVMRIAAAKCSIDVFRTLTASIEADNVSLITFQYVRRAEMSMQRRYWLYESLLRRGLPSDELSDALVEFLGTQDLSNLDIPKLFLKHGASVQHHDYMAISHALSNGSAEMVRCLCQDIKDTSAANRIFKLISESALPLTDMLTIYPLLLHLSIDAAAVHAALMTALSGKVNPKLVKLLLQHGAQPNKDNATAFVIAAQRNLTAEFKELCFYARHVLVVRALMTSIKDERQLEYWVRVCLTANPSATRLDDEDLLFECLERFPAGFTLLQLLLDHGMLTTGKRPLRLYRDKSAEVCTALIWSVFHMPRIENNVVLLLIRSKSTDMSYVTPKSRISVVGACLLVPDRAAIMQRVIALDELAVTNYRIPAPSLLGLLSQPDRCETTLASTGEISMLRASLYCGNIATFEVAKSLQKVEDDMLYFATMMALPAFVAILLETEDANKITQGKTALAWAANLDHAIGTPDQDNFRARQKQVMELLVPQTNLSSGNAHKTVFHIALETSVETARNLIAVLAENSDYKRDEVHLYTDKEGRVYTPCEYVREVLDCPPAQKDALLQCLHGFGFEITDAASDVEYKSEG